MVETLTRRLSLLASLLFLPAILLVCWWAWLGFDDDLQAEKHRIHHFEELAAYHVVNNLGAELFHLDFTFRLGVTKAIRDGITDWPRQVESLIGDYREQAHYPALLNEVLIASDPEVGPRRWLRWTADGWVPTGRPDWLPSTEEVFDLPADPLVDAEKPWLVVSLPARQNVRQVLVIRFDADQAMHEIVPALAQKAFDDGNTHFKFDVSVFRQSPLAPPLDSEADLVLPLVPRARFSDWLRNYLDRSPETPPGAEEIPFLPANYLGPESRWSLQVKVLPHGLADFANRIQTRNVVGAVSLFALLAAGYSLFLTLILRLLRLSRREKAFSTLVSHELKTPVSAIRSLSENLAEGVVSEGGKVREYGSLIVEQSQRLGELVTNILSLSTLESAPKNLMREEFDAGELMKSVAGSFGLKVGIEGPWRVLGNKVAVRAALDNLVTNALRYGAKDGAAPLVVLTVYGEIRRGKPWVCLAVTDHGPGLSRAEIKTIFEPYRRGRQARQQQIPGGGIGLSLVRATMKHLGGRVQVKAVPGGGLSFILWLQEGRRP